MYSLAKTIESPCRTCHKIDQDKDECAVGCTRLSAFQSAILRKDEIHIKNFQVRYPVPHLVNRPSQRP